MGDKSRHRRYTLIILIILFALDCNIAQTHKELRLCTFHGTVADPSDCSAYYHCAEGKLYHYNCGRNSAFDPSLHTCVSPPNQVNCPNGQKYTERSLESDSFLCTEDGYFRNTDDCTRFYRCSKHSKHAFSCPLGMAFNSNKITCDPIDSVPDCAIDTQSYGAQSTFEPHDFEPQKQAARSMPELNQPDSNLLNQNPNTPDMHYNAQNNKRFKPDHDAMAGNAQSNPSQPVTNKGDLFYLWNFDGQAGFDEYVSLEEAANMQYKMPDLENNGGNINLNSHNSIPDNDILIDFTDRPSSSRSILQNSSPPKPFAQIEPKIGSEGIAGYHVWDLHQDNSLYQDLKQPGFQPGFPNPNYYKSGIQETPFYGVNDNQYHHKASYGQHRQRPRVNNNEAMPGSIRENPLDTDSGISIGIQYNSPDQMDYNGAIKAKRTAQVEKQGLSSQDGTRRGHYGSIRPLERTYRRPVPRLIPYDDRDPFHCPHDGYFRDEGDCSRFYHCTHGLPYMVKCNGGLYFNPANKICDWPARVPGCSDRMRKVFVSTQRLNDPENTGHVYQEDEKAQEDDTMTSQEEDSKSDDTTASMKNGETDITTGTNSNKNPQINPQTLAKESLPVEKTKTLKQGKETLLEVPPSKLHPLYHGRTDKHVTHYTHHLQNDSSDQLNTRNSSRSNASLDHGIYLRQSLKDESSSERQIITKNRDISHYDDHNNNTNRANVSATENHFLRLQNVVKHGKQISRLHDLKRLQEAQETLGFNVIPIKNADSVDISHHKKIATIPLYNDKNISEASDSKKYLEELEEEITDDGRLRSDQDGTVTEELSHEINNTSAGSYGANTHDQNKDKHLESHPDKHAQYIPVLVKNNDCVEVGYHRHPSDCSVFYRCTAHSKIEYRCEADMAYHIQIKACLPREMVDGCA